MVQYAGFHGSKLKERPTIHVSCVGGLSGPGGSVVIGRQSFDSGTVVGDSDIESSSTSDKSSMGESQAFL